MAAAPAVEQAFAVLTLLTRMPEPLAASLIATTLNLPRSTTYRLLGVLEGLGMVSYLPDQRRYALGAGVFELGSAFQRQAPLARLARPILHRLVVETTQNAHLAVLHGRDVYYVVEERAAGRRGLVTDVGVRLPATLTASGLAMLAALPAPAVRAIFPDPDSLTQRNDLGPRTPTELRRLLSDVRRRGYALEQDSVTVGLSSVALAVIDHVGHPLAAMTVTYATEDVGPDTRRSLVAAVDRAVRTLTRRIGGLR